MANQIAFSPEAQAQIDRLSRQVEKLQNQIQSKVDVSKKDWYRPTEVCRILGISRSKFEGLKRSGMFSPRRVGGVVYIAASELNQYLPTSK
jgi:predicted site-specific integrase-resolvase